MRAVGNAGLKQLLPLTVAALLLAGCAQVGDLSGGPRDATPPQLLEAYPPNGSRHFNGDRILLRFDERITLDRVRERLLVSPPLSVMPDVRLEGARQVRITLKEPLRPSTTYSFAIGEVVKDLTEGNSASGLTYVLSTGDHLDSGMVRGRVVDAFTGSPLQDVLVCLFDRNDTITIRTGRPAYVTRADKDGNFTLTHIRPGDYALFGLRDQNSNYRYDLPNEEVAFVDTVVVSAPNDSIQPLHLLRLFREEGAAQLVREARVTPDMGWQLVLARAARHLSVRDVARTGGNLRWAVEWGAARDTVVLWPSDTTLLGEGRYEITVDGAVLDTLRYRPLGTPRFHNGLHAMPLETPAGARLKMVSARPIATIDPDRFRLVLDSVPLPLVIERDSTHLRTFFIDADVPPGTTADITVLPKAVRGIPEGHNDTLRTRFGRAAEGSLGVLQVRVRPDSTVTFPLLLQLLDAQGRVVRESAVTATTDRIEWSHLQPGDHGLRLIEDRNANGRWDPGALDERRPPERVWHHADKVNVRAGWDLLVEWSLR
jgi:hypothetical protein